MAEKKYFWLKLKNNFFAQPKIKKLRKIAGGDTYTIIYLKMQLLSLQNNAKLFFEGIEDNFVEEIALTIDEDMDNVKVTIQYLMAQGLLEEVSTDEFLLSETLSNIGSETRQAEIMRKKRADKSNDVTQLLPNVTKCYTEIEKEIEKEIDIELEKEQEIETEIDLETEKKKPKVAKAPIVFYPNDELLNQAFKDYIDMRKKIKATMTDRAIQMSINKLDELSQGDNDKAIKILEQSIMNSWKGLFALKEEKPASKSVDWDNV